MRSQVSPRVLVMASAAILLTSLSACKSGSDNGSVMLSGAGSTFVNPVMTRWTADYQQAHNNVQINYQSIGGMHYLQSAWLYRDRAALAGGAGWDVPGQHQEVERPHDREG